VAASICPQVDRLVIAQHELSAAKFFDVDQIAEVMPARLARRVIYAATGHDNTYLEHGTAPAITSPAG
jgi:hypothetical protein